MCASLSQWTVRRGEDDLFAFDPGGVLIVAIDFSRLKFFPGGAKLSFVVMTKRQTQGNAGAAKPAEQGAEGSTVWFMPNLSHPRPPNYKTCPILLIRYPVVQNGDEKHYSFGFVATSFQPVQMNVGAQIN